MEEMEDAGDLERDGGVTAVEPHPQPCPAPDEEFTPLSAVDLDGEGEDSGGSGSCAGSGDPWGRVGELPTSLGDKMLALRMEA